MIKDKITVYGEKLEALSICDLLDRCSACEELSLKPIDVYLWDSTDKIGDFEKAEIRVIPLDMSDCFPKESATVTYSDSDSSADICAINPQKRESSTCFELLCGAFMSRVFIPNESKYTVRQVLVCASVLYALGIPMKKVVSLINESLK